MLSLILTSTFSIFSSKELSFTFFSEKNLSFSAFS